MTSNTEPSGIVSASKYLDDFLPWKSFNGNYSAANCCILSRNEYSTSDYVQYQFENPTIVRKILIRTNGVGERYATSFRLCGSNDGVNFTNLIDCVPSPFSAHTSYYFSFIFFAVSK